jgi:hypothetical protein
MSNFSDFFPAAGGTASGATSQIINGTTYGNIIAKPTDPQYLISASGKDYVYLGGYASSSNDFQIQNDLDPMNYFVTVDAINTYYTIADITGASNGGFLYNIISPYSAAVFVSIFRITLDGTAYTFSRNMLANNRLIAGPFATMDTNVGQGFFNMSPDGPSGDEFNAGQPTRFQYARVLTGSVAAGLNLPKIFFNSSCKVEAQVSVIAPSNAPYGRYAFCSIETL